MGTSGAYSGSGGNDGKAVRDAIRRHLDTLPGSDTSPSPSPVPLDPAALERIINLIRPRSAAGSGADGPAGGGGQGATGGTGARGGGGPQRTATASARTAGRAAAAAAAYSAGDAATLQRLGLDYQELRSLGDDVEVVRRIVDMACAKADSTIPDHEQRHLAADVAEWVLTRELDGTSPTPEEIVRQSIAAIITETILVESGDLINSHENSLIVERDIRDAAEALADKATLTVTGATENDISRAIEDGLDTLRTIIGKDA